MKEEILKEAITEYNKTHRKYKIEYGDIGNYVIVISDKEDKFKAYLGFEYDMTVDEIIKILEDLRKDLK